MVQVKRWPFFQLFFPALQARKMSFTIFENEKTSLQGINTRCSKSQKIDIFSKGLTRGFGPKMAIFPFFFQGIKGQVNAFQVILERKNAFLDYKNKKFENCHGLGQKMASFPSFFFRGKNGQENVFQDILKQKTLFLGIKTRSSKSRKI